MVSPADEALLIKYLGYGARLVAERTRRGYYAVLRRS